MAYAAYEAEVREHFPFCPLCGSENLKINIVSFGRDTMTCKDCGATWHLHFSRLSGFAWAELEAEADDGTGREFLGHRTENSQWQKMAREARKRRVSQQSPPPPSTIKEKETIIKEIVMIPCKYCGALMPQTSIFCPNCGARRTA